MACLRGADEGWTEECRSVWHHESQWREDLHTRGLSGSGASRSSSVARGPLTRRSTFFSVVLGSGAGCPALAAARTARRWREEGRRHPMRVDWVPGFPSLVSHPPLLHPLPTALAHCPLPTPPLHSHIPHSHRITHTHTHRFVRLRHHSQLFHFRRPSTPPPETRCTHHYPLLTQTMPRKFCASPPPARTLKSGI